MAKKLKEGKPPTGADAAQPTPPPAAGRPSALLDTRVICCGDNLDQLAKLPDKCVDLIYIDPPFNSNRNYDVFVARRRKSAPSRTATAAPRRTSVTCGPAASSSPASGSASATRP